MTSKIEAQSFNALVYEIVKMIPCGRVTSYGAIAKAIGFPNYSRRVGTALAQCGEQDERIPAHRVLNSNGYLSGAANFSAPGQMQKLLEQEGIVVVKNKVRDFKFLFWNPIDEISI